MFMIFMSRFKSIHVANAAVIVAVITALEPFMMEMPEDIASGKPVPP